MDSNDLELLRHVIDTAITGENVNVEEAMQALEIINQELTGVDDSAEEVQDSTDNISTKTEA